MSQIHNQIGYLVVASLLTFMAVFWMFSFTWAGTTAGLFFGGFLASLTLVLGMVSLGIQHMRQQSLLSDKQKSIDNLSSHQERIIEIDLPFDSAFTLATEALNSLNNQDIPITVTGIPSKQTLQITKSDATMGRIEAKLKAKTFGIQDVTSFSKINIQLKRINSDTTRIQIESAPTSALENFELGRHIHYVNALAVYMRQATAENNLREQFYDMTSAIDNRASSQRLGNLDAHHEKNNSQSD